MDFADFSLDEIFPAAGSGPLPSLDDVLTFLASDPDEPAGPGGNLSDAPCAPPGPCKESCPEEEKPEEKPEEDKASRAKKAREKAMLKRERKRETDARARKRRADHVAGLEAENKRLQAENDHLRTQNAALAKRVLPLPSLASTI